MPDPLGGIAYTWPLYAAFALAYLIGTIPFGMILTRLAGKGDIRDIGSGNIGATNVLRTGNKTLAALTMLADIGKGWAVVFMASYWGPDMAVVAALGAVIGHVFPVWLKFRGGKGVSTTLGVFFGLAWPVAILGFLTWLVTLWLTRYSSVAAITSLLSAPLYAWWLADMQRVEVAGVLALLVIARHHGNIRRLIRGEEPRLSR
ncbi:MAG: glycerol-3-phosphate 1-O-acyltransferase PlsY [Alphaproteobacteria bacterium]